MALLLVTGFWLQEDACRSYLILRTFKGCQHRDTPSLDSNPT